MLFRSLYALARLGDSVGVTVLAGALAVRLLTAATILGWGFRDREGLRSIAYLVARDLVALVSWFLAFTKRTTVWRGSQFILTRDGRLVTAREVGS